MNNELMKLIEDYAEWSAQSYWQDDQGYTEYVEIARANKEAARKAVVDAVAALKAQEPVEFSQFLTDVLTAAGLVEHGKQSKALANRLSEGVMRFRAHPAPKLAEDPVVKE